MKKVLAVVVTYNRLNCIKECLNALRAQSFEDFDILIVNNGSTDGTKEFLDAQSDIIVIHQENLGGAGGFYAGMKFMLEQGYEWLWMMDDDGIPDTEQLLNLIKYGIQGYHVLNALVVDKNNHERLAFNCDKMDVVYYKGELTSKIFQPFNGTFLHRSVIERIGLIKKEMIIWGDEQEYSRRMKANGYELYTVIKAIHYHPKEKGKSLRVLPFKDKPFVLDKPKSLSKIYYRNLGYIDKVYNKGFYPQNRNVFFNVISFLWHLRWGELARFIFYYSKGRRGIFDIKFP